VGRFYLRWAGVLLVGGLIAWLGARRYCHDVAALSVEALMARGATKEEEAVRVLGQVVSEGMTREPNRMRFRLAGATQQIIVDYFGDDTESIRALKTVVMIGRWTPSTQTLTAHDTAPIPNAGYVAAAYLVGLIPTALFLFFMERKVAALYVAIKQEKVYEPERGS